MSKLSIGTNILYKGSDVPAFSLRINAKSKVLNLSSFPLRTKRLRRTFFLEKTGLKYNPSSNICSIRSCHSSLESSRLYSTSPALFHPFSEFLSNNDTFDTSTLCNGKIPLPVALSPSSAAEFKACPQSYMFKYLYGIKQPPNDALAKGSMCHKALEQIFDLPPQDRTLDHLETLLRKSWSEVRLGGTYRHLFDVSLPYDDTGQQNMERKRDVDAERQWGNSAIQLLRNYFDLEDPRLVPAPNPIEREVWVKTNLTLDPLKGVTGYAASCDSDISKDSVLTNANMEPDCDGDTVNTEDDDFVVRGIVDRIDLLGIHKSHKDRYSNTNEDPQMVLRIIDYKTGNAPNFKYSRVMNDKIADDNMWQLKIYALLIREMLSKGKGTYNLHQIPGGGSLRMLRLMYLTSIGGNARYLDMDLGNSREERDTVLQNVHADLAHIWKSILTLVSRQDPKAFIHCDRTWCYCHTIRPKFIPGTLWEK